MCSKTIFSGLSQTVWGFFWKKFGNCIWYPAPPLQEKVIFTFAVRCPVPSKIVMPNEKYSKHRCLQKRLY